MITIMFHPNSFTNPLGRGRQKLGDYLHQALLSGRWFAVVRNIFYQVGRHMSENCNITDDIDGVVL